MKFDNDKAVTLPASKSIAARFLTASYFAGTLPLDRAFDDSEDIEVLQDALLTLFTDEEPIDFGGSPLDIGNSATALRFVTAVCASTPEADFVVTGTDRVCRRPMQPLIDVLKAAGADIDVQGENGVGPFRVKGKRLAGGEFSIPGNISSQFISALMLVSPSWAEGMKLNFTPPLVSSPYITMTKRVMEKFGVSVRLDDKSVMISHSDYRDPGDFRVEADWSAASFFYEAVALGASPVCINNLGEPASSLQGDAAADAIFSLLGTHSEFSAEGVVISSVPEHVKSLERDFADNPDLVLPVAVACALKGIPFHFSGIGHLKYKESDRLDALQKELMKFGVSIEKGDDFLRWDGAKIAVEESPVDPHGDHRVAMAFAMTAFVKGRVRINNPEVVEKSFITFWQQLPLIGLQCTLSGDVMTIERI